MEFSQKSKLLKRSGDEGCQDNNLCGAELKFFRSVEALFDFDKNMMYTL